MKNQVRHLTFAVALLTSVVSQAFYTFQDSGDLLEPGHYALGTELQMVTSHNEGVNVVGKFDGGLSDEFNYRAVVGFGEVNFQMQGLIKWVPIPDIDNQPAIGFTTGFLYAKYDTDSSSTENEFSIRFIPFLSKKFDSAVGPFTPYVAFPMAVRTYNSDSDVPLAIAIGSKSESVNLKGVEFTAELGFDIDKAYNYVSLGAIFPFDEGYNFKASK